MSKATFFIEKFQPGTDFSSVLEIPGVYVNKKNSCILFCSDHAAWLVEKALYSLGVKYSLKIEDIEERLNTFPQIKNLKVDTSFLMSYQKEFVQNFVTRKGALANHAAGAGKTLSCLAWSMYADGLIVVITRAAARIHWAEEIKRYTTEDSIILKGEMPLIDTYTDNSSMVPSGTEFLCNIAEQKSSNIGKWNTVARLRKGLLISVPQVITEITKKGMGCRDVLGVEVIRGTGSHVFFSEKKIYTIPRFLICGWESLPIHIAFLKSLPVVSVIWDEIHKGKSHRRATALYGEDGKITFSSKENVSSSASELAKHAKRRVGATATPIPDRLHDLWAQLDLVEPYQWGSFGGPRPGKGGFTGKYCGGCASKYTTWDTKGIGTKAQLDELNKRLSFVMHTVPREVTHANLPAKRRIVTRIDESELNDPTPEVACELKNAAKESPSRIPEARLAYTASRKRQYVLDLVDQALDARQKVVVFTARRKDCELLAKATSSLNRKRGANSKFRIWYGHGNFSVEERERMRAEFMADEGPCCLIGTGEAFGESINIHDTDLFIAAMLPLNVRQLKQWEGRFTRLGQKRPVIMQYIIAEGTTDERVAEILLDKLPACSVVADTEMSGIINELEFGGKEDEINNELFQSLMTVDIQEIADDV
jgi:hypothetical protein